MPRREELERCDARARSDAQDAAAQACGAQRVGVGRNPHEVQLSGSVNPENSLKAPGRRADALRGRGQSQSSSTTSNALAVADSNFSMTKAPVFNAKTGDLDFYFKFASAGTVRWKLSFKNADVGFADSLGLSLNNSGFVAETTKRKSKSGSQAPRERAVHVPVHAGRRTGHPHRIDRGALAQEEKTQVTERASSCRVKPRGASANPGPPIDRSSCTLQDAPMQRGERILV
jgi:hypothetical protein